MLLELKGGKPKIIVILGPTASGKSALAVEIAKRFNGEIISADSRQVYQGLNIGSGKITKKEMGGVPHHLIDVVSPKKTFTVVQYQKLAKKTIGQILNRNKLPIICGGTGFYIDALIYNYQLPKVPPQKHLRKKLDKKSPEELFKILSQLDPERAQNIDPYNKRRLIRALEIVMTTGLPVPKLFANNSQKFAENSYDVLKIGIGKSGVKLKKLIDQRVGEWINRGLIQEVKNLHKNSLSWHRLNELGLEYRITARYLQNLISYEQMVEMLKKETWRYAKRQMTWIRRDKEIHWVKTKKEAFCLVKDFLS